MSDVSGDAVILGLAQDRCGNQSEHVAASESAYVAAAAAAAVVVELYIASAAVVAVAVVAAAAACVRIPFPAALSAQSLPYHDHPVRIWARRDARFPSLASSH
jgi:hypothetical protein